MSSSRRILFKVCILKIFSLEALQFGEILDTDMTERDVVSIGTLSKLRHLFINENHIVTDAVRFIRPHSVLSCTDIDLYIFNVCLGYMTFMHASEILFISKADFKTVDKIIF